MKRKLATVLAAMLLSAAMALPTFAAGWQRLVVSVCGRVLRRGPMGTDAGELVLL